MIHKEQMLNPTIRPEKLVEDTHRQDLVRFSDSFQCRAFSAARQFRWWLSAPPTKDEPKCFAQLKHREVDHPIADVIDAQHSFWWVQDRTGAHYITTSGRVPYDEDGKTVDYLEAVVARGDSYDRDVVTNSRTEWDAGLSTVICDNIDRMLAAARSFPKHTITYGPILGPNSNSAARYFGEISGFHPSRPPRAFAWDTAIPLP